MIYRGIEYEIEPIKPGLWKYQFCIGAVIRTGKTKSSLELLAESSNDHRPAIADAARPVEKLALKYPHGLGP